MATQQPFVTDGQGRRFAGSAVAVQAIIVHADERLLLLSSPTRNRPGEWQVTSGSLEAAETVSLACCGKLVRKPVRSCGYGRWVWCMPTPSILTSNCGI